MRNNSTKNDEVFLKLIIQSFKWLPLKFFNAILGNTFEKKT